MSFSTFNSILISALDAYRRQTGKDLVSDPLHLVLEYCNSPGAMLTVLQDQMPDFYRSDAENHRLTNMLVPMANVLYMFSVTLGEGVGLVNITTIRPRQGLMLNICFADILTGEAHIRGRGRPLDGLYPPSP
jgi:hypothetical protein